MAGSADRGPDEVEVPADFVPPGYISTVASFPNMGVHWLAEDAAELQGQTFDKTMLYGFSRGEMVFIEPMVTLALLESRQDVGAPVAQPAAVQKSGFYPTRYRIRYEGATKQYLVSLEHLVQR